jgi:acetyl-CoA carboxylase biotin carboxyl carrier protein
VRDSLGLRVAQDHPLHALCCRRVKVNMELTYSDVEKILKIIDEAEHLDEIELVYGGFRLHVVRNGTGGGRPVAITAAPPVAAVKAVAPVAAAVAPRAAEEVVPEGVIAIRAPMLGIFYRASAPGEKPFVEEGQRVRADDTVCLIEVMKLFNSIRAGIDGKVVKILAENNSLVEFNQALVLIELAGKGQS